MLHNGASNRGIVMVHSSPQNGSTNQRRKPNKQLNKMYDICLLYSLNRCWLSHICACTVETLFNGKKEAFLKMSTTLTFCPITFEHPNSNGGGCVGGGARCGTSGKYSGSVMHILVMREHWPEQHWYERKHLNQKIKPMSTLKSNP